MSDDENRGQTFSPAVMQGLVVGMFMLIVGIMIGQVTNNDIVESINAINTNVNDMKLSVETRFTSNDMNTAQMQKDISTQEIYQKSNYASILATKDEVSDILLRLAIIEASGD
jgi:hypothetical protein